MIASIAAMLLLAAGCGPLVEGQDYWIDQSSRTIVARNTSIAGTICLMRGTRPSAWPDRTILGCYDSSDDVIVAAEDSSAWVVAHEQAHRQGWQHAPDFFGADGP